jgi:hypothetical protein
VLARLRTLTSHHGRHTFITHALAGGRTLAEVRAAAGHSNVAIRSGYLHVVVEKDGGVGELLYSMLLIEQDCAVIGCTVAGGRLCFSLLHSSFLRVRAPRHMPICQTMPPATTTESKWQFVEGASMPHSRDGTTRCAISGLYSTQRLQSSNHPAAKVS